MLEMIPQYDAWKTLSQPEEDVNMATLLDQCRPCPFCGPGCVAVDLKTERRKEFCKALGYYREGSFIYRVVYDCGAIGPLADSLEEAVERANRRRNA